MGFSGRIMRTPIYIKMDAHEQLLLSEGVCRQLGVISYHPDVERWRGGRKQPPQLGQEQPSAATTVCDAKTEAKVPTVRVRLVQAVQLLPHQGAVVQVCAEPELPKEGLMVMEPAALESGYWWIQPCSGGLETTLSKRLSPTPQG